MGLSFLFALFGPASQLPSVDLPDQLTKTVTYAAPVHVKGETVKLVGTEEKPAILAFEGKGTIVEDCTFELTGRAWVILYRTDGAVMRNCTFRGGTEVQLRVIRANDVTIEGSRFLGGGENRGSLFEVMPG